MFTSLTLNDIAKRLEFNIWEGKGHDSIEAAPQCFHFL